MKRQFQRENHFNRGRDDIRRQILDCLHQFGPTPMTELLYRIQLNHLQAKVYLHELIDAALIIRKPLSEMIRELEEKQLGRLAVMSDNVTDLFIITKKGEKYLDKLNEMEVFIKWQK